MFSRRRLITAAVLIASSVAAAAVAQETGEETAEPAAGAETGAVEGPAEDGGATGADAGVDCPEDGSESTGILVCDRLAVGSSVELDLDGDGRAETVRFSRKEDRYYLEVTSPEGDRHELGVDGGPSIAKRFYMAESDDDDAARPHRGGFGWVVHWEVVRAKSGVLAGSPGWEVSEALGDGLQLAALSAQLLLYRSEDGWVVTNLGY